MSASFEIIALEILTGSFQMILNVLKVIVPLMIVIEILTVYQVMKILAAKLAGVSRLLDDAFVDPPPAGHDDHGSQLWGGHSSGNESRQSHTKTGPGADGHILFHLPCHYRKYGNLGRSRRRSDHDLSRPPVFRLSFHRDRV